MRTCLILPTYNEDKMIVSVIRSARRVIPHVVVVDDGSTDQTAERVRLLPQKDKSTVTLLQHKHNLGKGMALRTGFAYALSNGFDIVVTMDTDGQHDVADLPRFLSEFRRRSRKNSIDILVGSRTLSVHNSSMPLHRRLNNWLVSTVGSQLCGQRVPDFQSGFRLIRSTVLKKVKLETVRYETESELLIKAGLLGFRIHTLPISVIYGDETSYIRAGREIWLFTKLLIRSLQSI